MRRFIKNQIYLICTLASPIIPVIVWICYSNFNKAIVTTKQEYAYIKNSIIDLYGDHSFQPMIKVAPRETKHCLQNADHWNCIGGYSYWSVIFIDHRPKHRRAIDIERLRSRAEIIVAHDTENQRFYGYEQLNWTNSFVDLSRWKHTRVLQGNRPSSKYVFEKCVEIFTNRKKELDFIARKFDPNSHHYATHIPLLVAAVWASEGNILEMGVGDYSTPVLHELVEVQAEKQLTQRKILSSDADGLWLSKFRNFSSNWHQFRFVPVFNFHKECFNRHYGDFDISFASVIDNDITFSEVECP